MQELTFEQVEHVSGGVSSLEEIIFERAARKLFDHMFGRKDTGQSDSSESPSENEVGDPNTYPGEGLPPK
ncbi:hypothetical protein [Alishewanella longhuensis]